MYIPPIIPPLTIPFLLIFLVEIVLPINILTKDIAIITIGTVVSEILLYVNTIEKINIPIKVIQKEINNPFSIFTYKFSWLFSTTIPPLLLFMSFLSILELQHALFFNTFNIIS